MFDNVDIFAGMLFTLIPVLLFAVILGLIQIAKGLRQGFGSSKSKYVTKANMEEAARGIAQHAINQKIKVLEKRLNDANAEATAGM